MRQLAAEARREAQRAARRQERQVPRGPRLSRTRQMEATRLGSEL